MKHVIALALLLILPTVAAQQYATGEGDAYIGLPHSVAFMIGENDLAVVVAAIAVCEMRFDAPAPLRIQAVGVAPDDGAGPAWAFDSAAEVPWVVDGDGNYSIETTITMNVTGYGYGEAGRSAEFTLTTAAVQDDSCSTEGFTMPARSGHAHASVPARPADSSNDAPGPALFFVVAALGIVAWRRR